MLFLISTCNKVAAKGMAREHVHCSVCRGAYAVVHASHATTQASLRAMYRQRVGFDPLPAAGPGLSRPSAACAGRPLLVAVALSRLLNPGPVPRLRRRRLRRLHTRQMGGLAMGGCMSGIRHSWSVSADHVARLTSTTPDFGEELYS